MKPFSFQSGLKGNPKVRKKSKKRKFYNCVIFWEKGFGNYQVVAFSFRETLKATTFENADENAEKVTSF
jgi:hypothetical protein